MGVLLRLFPTLALAALVGGCAVPSATQRTAQAEALAQRAGWRWQHLQAGRFVLAAGLGARPVGAAGRLAVFIEGDGLSWLDPHTPSTDPTPLNPVALRMALTEPHLPSAYLGRPCQYGSLSGCTEADWTDARFSPDVLVAMGAALDQIKRQTAARELVLVGYSGGGAAATLLAAQRPDVVQLVTVAAVLDTDRWTRQHGLTPLKGSLNPAHVAHRLEPLPQTHLVGADDRRTGVAAIAPYAARNVAGFGHTCCWAEQWPTLSPLGHWPTAEHYLRQK